VDYIHAAVVIFLSRDGMIARYLEGMKFNPADMELAVIDASTGTARAFMRKAQRLCYAFDENASTYVLQVNRVILGITGLFVLLFLVFLAVKKPAPKHVVPDEEDAPKPDTTESAT
jgi:protein SCO1